MKVKLALTFAALLAICLVGCAVPGPVVAGATIEDGAIVFSATGKSIVEEVGDPYATIKAEAAAETTAKANLLGKISGMSLAEGISVGDLHFESQEAEAAVAGWLARATVTFNVPEPGLGPDNPTIIATARLALSAAEYESLELYAD